MLHLVNDPFARCVRVAVNIYPRHGGKPCVEGIPHHKAFALTVKGKELPPCPPSGLYVIHHRERTADYKLHVAFRNRFIFCRRARVRRFDGQLFVARAIPAVLRPLLIC